MNQEEVERRFSEVIGAICRHPKMYLMHGTFGEALAYLDGYANGRRIGMSGRSASVFTPFRRWLTTKLILEDTEEFWATFRGLHTDDQEALKYFAEYWTEYIAFMARIAPQG
jgi:hypothetical protein